MKPRLKFLFLSLILSLISCGKQNHTGFEKSDYSLQKKEDLSILYRETNEGNTEEKNLKSAGITLKKTHYSQEFQNQFKEIRINSFFTSKKENQKDKMSFTNAYLESVNSIYYPKFQHSLIDKFGVFFQFLNQSNYHSNIAFCDEFLKMEQNNESLEISDNQITYHSSERKTLTEINENTEVNQTYYLKTKRELCLKIPRLHYEFSLKNSPTTTLQSFEKEVTEKLSELVRTTDWKKFEEQIPAWHLKFLGKFHKNDKHIFTYSYTLYDYLPLDTFISHEISFNWVNSPITISSDNLEDLTQSEKLPLEFIAADELIPFAKESTSTEHIAQMIRVPNEICVTFTTTLSRSRNCEKKPNYKDMGYDLISRNDLIHYNAVSLSETNSQKMLNSLFSYEPDTQYYFSKQETKSFPVKESLIIKNNQVDKKTYDGKIENIQKNSSSEQVKHIYQLRFLRHFDQWKKAEEFIELL